MDGPKKHLPQFIWPGSYQSAAESIMNVSQEHQAELRQRYVFSSHVQTDVQMSDVQILKFLYFL